MKRITELTDLAINYLLDLLVKGAAIMRPAYLFLPGIIFLALYYVIIVKFSLGQDMLIYAVEKPLPLVFFNLSLLLWILFSWFSSRLVSDIYIADFKATHGRGPDYISIYEHFPRLLGYNAAVALQFAAINLPTVQFKTIQLPTGPFNVRSEDNFGWILIAFFVAHNFYYFLWSRIFSKKQQKMILLAAIYGLAYIGFLTYAFFNKVPNISNIPNEIEVPNHHYVWFILAVFYFLLGILFIWIVLARKGYAKTISSAASNRWWLTYNIVSWIAFAFYLGILFSHSFAKIYGALGCALLAFGLWIGIICWFKSYGITKKVRFGMLILLLAVGVGSWVKKYGVDLPKTEIANTYDERPDINLYLERWLKDSVRAKKIDSATVENPYMIYLVIADGGASKSGYWTAGVLARLQEESEKKWKDPFSDHLLSISGASGGSVGNAAFYSLLHANKSLGQSVNYRKETDNFFRGDFLTRTVACYFGPDLISHLIPLPMNDRAAALEKSMECMSDSEIIGSNFKKPIEEVLDTTGHLPLLFINTTNLEEGLPSVVSSIRMTKPFGKRGDVLELINKQDNEKKCHMKLSTAAVISSRFPYLSPAGEIHGKYFVDGGYFDNSGSGITLELLGYLKKRMKDPNDVLFKLDGKLRFKVIYISNGPLQDVKNELEKQEDLFELHPLANDLAAPLLTVLGTFVGQTDMGNYRLQEFIGKENFIKINLPLKGCATDEEESANPEINPDLSPYPMNWVLSKYSMGRIKRNINCFSTKGILTK